MKYCSLILLIFFTGATYIQAQHSLPESIDKKFINQVLVQPQAFTPVPRATDSYWQQHVPAEMRKAYISFAERYLNCKWQSPSPALFAEFKKNGNRTNYEGPCFVLRKQLSNLVMAEIMEQKGRFIPDIVKGLAYFKTETWWGIPAHYPLDHPEPSTQVVDLFNAETANLLAWAVYMLHPQLEQAEHGICQHIKDEIKRRVLLPALNENYWWKHSTSNWNTWICENWLSCVLLCESDRSRQVQAVSEIISCLSTFYKDYPDDGGCNEGIFYWDRATASFSQCMQLLSLATDNRLSMGTDEKFRKMSRYVFATYVSANTFVNFADAPTFFRPNTNILFPLGRYLNDGDLLGFAAKIANDVNIYNETKTMFSNQEIPSLSRELLFISNIQTYKEVQPSEPLLRDNYLPTLQIFTARSAAGTTKGLFVAMKGGHNAEEHNHNDVGNFVVYADGEPLIVDIGRGTYTAQAATHRYEHLHMRSAYHNVPLVNGMEQKAGKQYHATILSYDNEPLYASLSLDLTEAYPQEAALRQWRRTVRLNRGRNVVVTDNYHLQQYQRPTQLVLISYGPTRVERNGVISITSTKGTHLLKYNSSRLKADVEKIQIDDSIIVNAWQKKPLYRILLTVRSNALSGNLRYTIQ